MTNNIVKQPINTAGCAVVMLDGWAGRREYPVEIVRETPKRYEVRLLVSCHLGADGTLVLVPKTAVRRTVKPAGDLVGGTNGHMPSMQ